MKALVNTYYATLYRHNMCVTYKGMFSE